MCDVKVKDRVPSIELRERLGIDDIISVLRQNRLHVLRKKGEWLGEEMYGVWSEGIQTNR